MKIKLILHHNKAYKLGRFGKKMADKNCEKCHGTGIVKEKDGSVHVCFDCLNKGEMNQHSKDVKETKIKI